MSVSMHHLSSEVGLHIVFDMSLAAESVLGWVSNVA